MKDKRKNNGGARSGTGPKLKYGEQTERIFFTVPVSKKATIVSAVEKILSKSLVKK